MKNNQIKIRPLKSLKFKILFPLILLLFILASGLTGGIIWKYQNDWSKEIQNYQLQKDQEIINELNLELQKISLFTQNLKTVAENLPQNEEDFIEMFPNLANFSKHEEIIGSGYFPAPFIFDEEIEKRSFFWEKNSDKEFDFSENYNSEESNYFQEEWYVLAKYLQKNRCAWGKVYVTPNSYEAMITLTLASYNNDDYTGVVTVDWSLKKIQNLIKKWQKQRKGYIFITDQYNQFITFPKIDLIKKDKSSERFISVNELAQKQTLFHTIASEFTKINAEIIRQAKKMPDYNSKLIEKIKSESLSIKKSEAELLTAIIANPVTKKNFDLDFEVETDFLNKEKSQVKVFTIPENYWKIGIVTPTNKTANYQLLLNFLLFITVLFGGTLLIILILLAYWQIKIFAPLKTTTNKSLKIQNQLDNNKKEDFAYTHLLHSQQDEISRLTIYFNRLLKGVENLYKDEIEDLKEENDEQQTAIENISFHRDELKTEIENLDEKEVDNVMKLEILDNKLTEIINEKHQILNTNKEVQKPKNEVIIIPKEVEVVVEKIIEKEVEVVVEKIVEKEVEVVVEKIVEKEVEVVVEKFIEKEHFISLKIWDKILIIPETSTMNKNWESDYLDKILNEVKNENAEYIIMDISRTICEDENIMSKHLIKLSQTIKLMGADCIFVGITPIVAKTLLAMQTDVLAQIKTQVNLSKALNFILKELNLKIIDKN